MRETEKGAATYKKSPLDFALWKTSKPGEPSWESPWGPGRPGWHIECSAMVAKHLPDGADIHGGGTDLRFPHHENELAQSVGAHPERTFVRAWAHHGMVNLGPGAKMAKSVGNILDVKKAVELYGKNALRMWFLQSHYSQPIDYSEEILEEKKRSYERLRNLYARIADSTSSSELDKEFAAELRERFDQVMQDDFNTSEAIAALFEAASRTGQEIAARPEAVREFAGLKGALEEILTVLGFNLAEGRVRTVELAGEARATASATGRLIVGFTQEELPQDVLKIVAQREQARRKKDWTVADQLRDKLRTEGWIVEDTPEGPVLNRQ
jgi:cysteinyl-tRNA synthetase